MILQLFVGGETNVPFDKIEIGICSTHAAREDKSKQKQTQNKHRKQRKQKAENKMMKGRTTYYLDNFSCSILLKGKNYVHKQNKNV